jgi:lipopolysaccharide export system permease protein
MELLTPFLLSVLFFTFVFLMAKMIEIANWLVNYNLSLLTVLLLIMYSVPLFLVFIIPMSIMISILLTFLKLSNDNEIVALKTGGQSLYGLLPPVLLFCLMGFAANILITVYGLPWGNLSIRKLSLQVAASNADIGLKERTFNDSFKDVMLYVNKFDVKNKLLIDIFIEDKRQADIVTTVIAPRGVLYSEPSKFIFHLMLYDGTIYQTNLEDRLANWNDFETYRLSLDLQTVLSPDAKKKKHRNEMSLYELRQYIHSFDTKSKGYYKARLDYHRKFSIPFACFALGILAIPLGVATKSTKRSFGLGLGLFFFMLYYLLLTTGMGLGKSGMVPAGLAMWFPNLLLGGLGLFLFLRSARD